MRVQRPAATAAIFLCLFLPGVAAAQPHQAPAGSEAQRAAIDALDFLDGEWRGEAVLFGPGGTRTSLVQTERVGDLLGGWVKVIEGRGYADDGSTAFNAMAVISWDEAAGRYGFRSWSQGRSGDFRFEPGDDGFRWEVPAGPGAVMRYTATVRDGVWHEVGDYVREGAEPVRSLEMTLRRVGDTAWPAGDAVVPR